MNSDGLWAYWRRDSNPLHYKAQYRACLCLLGMAPGMSWAQPAPGNYPDKPVRLVVPFAAGASTDIVGRLLGQKFSEALNQPFIELIAWAKANPGKVTWGSSGVSSNPHAALETLKAVTGVNITHVPYKGTAPALTDAVGGQIDGLFTTTASVEPFIRSGRIKLLGVAGPKRQALIPNVPTFAEQGITGADNLLWMGLVTTGKVPRVIIDKLNREANRILQLPEVKQRFEQLGLDVEGGTTEHFEQLIKGQAQQLRALIKSGALKVE